MSGINLIHLKFILTTCIAFAVFKSTAQKFEQLALTPPMGWNSWNTFKTNATDSIVRGIADEIVTSGMREAGYTYVILDDGWMKMERDSSGSLVPDPVKFPNGIKALANYIHSRGLKIGIYNCAGTKTCDGFPGSRGYEYQDARLYASWDIDYFKEDWCHTNSINGPEAYGLMSDALRKAGRPVVFSVCEWGTDSPWKWAGEIAHLWRTTGDIYNCFDCLLDHGSWYWAGPMRILDMQKELRKYAGPGHWNDPDMLEVGNGLTYNENKAHFSMWCMLAAPLIAGNDIRKMDEQTKSVLTNREVIAVDQDSLGIQGFQLMAHDSIEVWLKPLMHDQWAVTFLNRSTGSGKIKFEWKSHLITDSLTGKTFNPASHVYQVRNLWLHTNTGTTEKSFEADISGHDAIVLRLI